MCGILGVASSGPVNQVLYDGLLVLQHRGQDAAGIVTAQGSNFHIQKGGGMVRDVSRTRNMRALPGSLGIAHCRYPTAGSASSVAEAQPCGCRPGSQLDPAYCCPGCLAALDRNRRD